MDYIVKTANLTKSYKGKKAVTNVSMNIKRGEIYGFLGKNGAGKTTTIRMIMGLIKPTSGYIELFGEQINEPSDIPLERIGSIIETPGFYPNLTAQENLEIHRRLMKMPNKNSVDEALDIVGLLNAKNRLAKTFSLGMKQRLGIARAILHHPELLILDEPTNGLDPVGIKEMRQLIMRMASERKITVLISSHILSEIEQMAETIGIIHQGRLIKEIDTEFIHSHNRHFIELQVDNDRAASLTLEQQLNIVDYKIAKPQVIRIYEQLDNSPAINRTLIENGINIRQSRISKDSLEDFFIKLTGEERHVD